MENFDAANDNSLGCADDPNKMEINIKIASSNEPCDYENNNLLISSDQQFIKNEFLTNAVEKILINESIEMNTDEIENTELSMAPKIRDLLHTIQIKDVKIKELEILVNQKNEEIANLKSHLDKFQSVFPYSRNSAMNRKIGQTIQRQRAQGISAEPQSQSSMHELLNISFPKYEKEDR